ncbi:uncharacterized protein FFFS_15893 [Fusarium fujikuroi]|nr:uncharacterized protein FFFS_15893 [Fusarium fujikuroi]
MLARHANLQYFAIPVEMAQRTRLMAPVSETAPPTPVSPNTEHITRSTSRHSTLTFSVKQTLRTSVVRPTNQTSLIGIHEPEWKVIPASCWMREAEMDDVVKTATKPKGDSKWEGDHIRHLLRRRMMNGGRPLSLGIRWRLTRLPFGVLGTAMEAEMEVWAVPGYYILSGDEQCGMASMIDGWG